MPHLHHETLNQADIPSGDAQNRCDGLLVSEIIGMGGHAMAPTLIEKKARLVIGQWLDLLHEPNSRVELRSACQALIQVGHPQQHEAKLSPIGDVTNHLQACVLEPVGFIDNQQFNVTGKAARHQKLFIALVELISSLNQIGKRRKQHQHVFFDACGRGRDRWGIKDCATFLNRNIQGSRSEGQGSVGIEAINGTASGEGDQGFRQEGFEQAPLRVLYRAVQEKWASEGQTHRLPTDPWGDTPFRYGLGDDSLPATTSESAAQRLVRLTLPLPPHSPLEHIQAHLGERADLRCGRNAPPCHAREEHLFRKKLTPCRYLLLLAPYAYW